MAGMPSWTKCISTPQKIWRSVTVVCMVPVRLGSSNTAV